MDLARQVGYVNAGHRGVPARRRHGDFYFLEMNTRLQVEHPVTELICGGLDLVEHQLRIAAGEPLSLAQDDLRIDGHAMEARVYAEDAFGGFLPQAGTTSIVRWPTGPGVRVDHALERGQVVSTSYDPMLGKVVVHGPDRETARHALVAALDDTTILGLTTNTGFLRALAASDAFRDATIDTAWLDSVDLAAEVPRPDDDLPRVLVAWTSAMITALRHRPSLPGRRLPARRARGRDAGRARPRRRRRPGGRHRRRSAGAPGLGRGPRAGPARRRPPGLRGRQRAARRAEVAWRGQRFVFTRPDRLDGAAAVADGTLLAPMPGTVLAVRVEEGARLRPATRSAPWRR